MRKLVLLPGVAAALFALQCPSAYASDVGPVTPPKDFVALMKKVVAVDGAPGVIAMVMKDGKLLYRVEEGDITPSTVLPIASASKWTTVTLAMTVVDEGKLSLDQPIGERLPEFTGEQAKITLRELLSFTSGQGGLKSGKMFDLRQDPRMTLDAAVKQISARPLEDPPGTAFKYGSPAMQVVGELVEQATGETWAKLFQERIAGPLGMTHTYWANPLKPDVPASEVRDPSLQAGVYTTAGDYAKFLAMLAAGGIYNGHRIISKSAFDTMETAQTLHVPMVYVPPGALPGHQYALGNWCETYKPNGQCIMISSPGAFGTYPWIDRSSGLYGLFFLKLHLPLVAADLRAARKIAIDQAK